MISAHHQPDNAPSQDSIAPRDSEAGGTADQQGESAGVQATGAKLSLALDLLTQAEGLLREARLLMEQSGHAPARGFRRAAEPTESELSEGQVIEGVFDGQKMVGPDGKGYSVPANYASKSKLVEGDLLKLTITERGAFIYKQIGPIARRRLRGVLVKDPFSHEFGVRVNTRTYHVLRASVTYFRGREDDEVVVLVPESGESRWAAVENILRHEGSTAAPTVAPAQRGSASHDSLAIE